MLATLTTTAALLPALINPTPVAPPGSEPILTIVNWVSWGAIVVAVIGFIVAAGGLALAHHTGREMDNFKGLAFALIAAILVGAAGTIVQTFV
jgi:hypothetical protein